MEERHQGLQTARQREAVSERAGRGFTHRSWAEEVLQKEQRLTRGEEASGGVHEGIPKEIRVVLKKEDNFLVARKESQGGSPRT